MSKKHRNKNYGGGTAAKKSSRAGLVGIATVLCAGVLAAGACVVGFVSRNDGGQWFKNSNLSTWHWSDNIGENNPIPQHTIGENGGIVSEDIDGNGLALASTYIAEADYALYGISERAVEAFTLTATFTPANATAQTVDYTIKWKDASSEWATGKNVTDYLDCVQTESGSKTATFTLKQVMSEPIIITATSRYEPSIKVSRQVDYICDTIGCGNWNNIPVNDNDLADPVFSFYNGTIIPVSSAPGVTIDDYKLLSTAELYVTLESNLLSYVRAKGYDIPERALYYEDFLTYNSYSKGVETEGDNGGIDYLIKGCFGKDLSSADKEGLWLTVCEYWTNNGYSSGDEFAECDIVVNRIYNGVNYGVATCNEILMYFGDDLSGLKPVPAQSMDIGGSDPIILG